MDTWQHYIVWVKADMIGVKEICSYDLYLYHRAVEEGFDSDWEAWDRAIALAGKYGLRLDWRSRGFLK